MKANEMNRRFIDSSKHRAESRRTSAKRMLTGIALASGLTALGWALDIVPIRWLSNSVAAASKSKSKGAGDEEKQPEAPVKKIRLNYFSASWPKVLQDLAIAGDMDVVADKYPTGRYSRIDRTEYTLVEAIRIVNQELERVGFRMVVKGQGQFLDLIELRGDRHEYPRAILPKKSPKPADEAEQVVTQPQSFRADTITPAGRDATNRNVRTEDVSERSIRYSNYRSRRSNDSDTDDERIPITRKSQGTRSVQLTSHQMQDDGADGEVTARPHLVESSAPAMLADVGAAAPPAVYRPRQLRAVELSKRIYRAMKSSSELVNAGRDGLPAVSIVSPQFKSPNPNTQQNGSARSVEFMISIDDERNELLIDGRERDAAAAMKLLRLIDRADEPHARTVIKPGSKYVCQVADQLPGEIERIRTGRGSDAFSQNSPDAKAARSAIERARRGTAQFDNDDPMETDQGRGRNAGAAGAIGNFKGEINIEVIPDLNVLVIRGNENDVEQILKVIRQIEQLSEDTAPQVHLLHLKNVDSESLAELMTSIYEKLTKFPGNATQPRQSVAIISVTKPNALLIVAPRADLDSILDLAEELDRPVDPQTEFQVFRLKFAVATEVEVQITEFYKEPKSLGTKVLVIADPRSNALIVRAAPRDLDEIKALIAKVDREDPATVSLMRVFPLKNAVAAELAAVINASIQSVLSPPTSSGGGGGGIGGGQGAQPGLGGGQVDEQFRTVKSTVLKFMSVQNGVPQQFKSGILSDIRVTPDAQANSLIVTASERSMELMAALIKNLDRPTSTVSEIKVFTLINADASQMVQQLNALFNNQQQGGQQRQQLGVAIATADDASSNLVPLKFSVDGRTNSVIAVGSADAMKVVEAILLRLDENNLRSRQNMVVRLNNAPATQIATAVTQFFQQQRDLSQQADPNLVSNVEQLEREVIVIPDTISNNLLVSSTPRYFPDVLAMIKRLDAEPKQVVIQALIVEVQLNNTDEFGIELGLQSPVLFNRSLLNTPVVQTQTNSPANSGGQILTNQIILSDEGSPGFNFNNPGVPLGNNVYSTTPGAGSNPGIVGGQSLTNFSLGRTNGQLGYGGLVLSAGSSSVNALLRALASKTKIEILSRPQIRALDSYLSEVFVGQTIPTVTSFQTNATTGVISPTLQQRDTGIGMQVTPRITQDGNVVIQLYAFRSQLSQSTVNVTTDSRGQPVGQRITDLSNVRTTVLVPSNSTIVIGGMISSRDETTARKAPFLGDLPVLGHLFRYDSRSTIRSELLIFLTPRVISGPEEEECFKDIEMGRLHFIESEAEEAHGPLRAIPHPDDVFDDAQKPWIGPGSPNSLPSPSQTPPMESMPLPPSPIQAPTQPPAVPPTDAPTSPVIPPPPLPDPNLTRINLLRTMATEQDDSASGVVTPASWTTPANARKRAAALKKSMESQK